MVDFLPSFRGGEAEPGTQACEAGDWIPDQR